MASLKELRVRINSVQSTKKITSAMKMVAASKLRRAQDAAEATRPYAERMERMLGNLAAGSVGREDVSPMLAGTGQDDVHLIVVMTANRGLCGGFNSNIIRSSRNLIHELVDKGKKVKLVCVGRKGRDNLQRDFRHIITEAYTEFGRKTIEFVEAEEVAAKITSMFAAGEFDVATLVYARFQSAMSQIVTCQQIIPFPVSEAKDPEDFQAAYDYEPSDQEILLELLPRNVSVQIFRAMLENSASFYGSQMTAMDSATRNAGEMIDKLRMKYNRTRQAKITTELIEIIAGAEAV
ncbi:MAG: F0F1 ATP synthase subunit gamma [Candidatus Marinimicrobia bacterium]|nr:F0F1 ATP synthase subunit gamma [Candidatus Neomarinimicrobiota bacterium]